MLQYQPEILKMTELNRFELTKENFFYTIFIFSFLVVFGQLTLENFGNLQQLANN